ncbi:MAG TPA: ABC transporter, partial [Thermoplasmata archaeon]|nr:ABC transporter [Thermoplasmata archaeon]
MPLMFASGALFPSQNYPDWMRSIAAVNPVGFSALLGRGIMVNGAADWTYLGYLGIFAAIMIIGGTLVAGKYLKVE